MISAASTVKYLHFIMNLNHEFQADVLWWLEFLPKWNEISMFGGVDWITNSCLDLYTDASDLAIAGYFQGAWFVELVSDTSISISWGEFYAVVLTGYTYVTFGTQTCR